MKVIDLTDVSLAQLRIKALDHAVAVCGPHNSNETLLERQAAVIDTARLFYMWLCEEDQRLDDAIRGKLKHAKDKP